ncbi:MAG: bifunctional metallophosphatase/5'-nucleotidase, partial [Spirochaetales bacterium]
MKIVKSLLAVVIILLALPLYAGEKLLTIIHTNDLHSHLMGFSPELDYTPDKTGDDATLGGWARVATVIKREKAARTNPSLVLDAGDFTMGSLFHLLAREEAIELSLMKRMG